MINMTDVINQMIELFIIMAIGYGANKFGIMNETINQGLSKIVIYISLPAMILSAVLNNNHTLDNQDVFILLSLAISMYIFLIFFAFLFTWIFRIPKSQIGIYRFLIIFTNIGFMGFPVVNSIFGAESVFYASIFQIPFCFLSYSLGIFLVAGEDKKITIKKALLHPGVISAVVALILYLCKIQLPNIVNVTFDCIGKITTPASMMIIGSTIATYSIKKAFSHWKMYPISILKQTLIPIVFWLIIRLLPIDPLMIGVTTIMIAMPSATNSTILCHEYNGDAELSSSGVFLSTIISVITIPILTYLLLR